MKYLIATAVVIVLILLPMGSYYYLKKGFDYRYNVLQELSLKSEFPSQEIYNRNGEKRADLLPRKVSQLYFSAPIENKRQKDIFSRLQQQFGNREYFQQVVVYEKGSENEISDLTPDSYFLNSEVSKKLGLETGKIYLIDTSSQIRNSYSLSDGDIKSLVSHTAILLPLPKKKEIKLRRKFDDK